MMNAKQVNSVTESCQPGDRMPASAARSMTAVPKSIRDSNTYQPSSDEAVMNTQALVQVLVEDMEAVIGKRSGKSALTVANRIAMEVQRICGKSDRIQTSGVVSSWQLTLARHRLQKCLQYYQLGSQRGRVELHGNLSVMVYRHIAKSGSQLGFPARYNLIEDFLQGFYVETLKAFRRENQLAEHYTPRTRLELAEYMMFCEQYAKRRISLPGGLNQRLIVLRAQSFARRQPPETSIDIEMAVESGKGEEAEMHGRNPAMQQVREKMVAAAVDPSESVLRDRVIVELVQYLESQEQFDCVDYLKLKLQDLAASEIDRVLDLSPRQRDYLQQRFKYHLEKFSRSHKWQLVHQWLGADLDQNLGLSPTDWQGFVRQLSSERQQLLQLKQSGASDSEIASVLKCTPKQVQKRWQKILELAWKARNQRPA